MLLNIKKKVFSLIFLILNLISFLFTLNHLFFSFSFFFFLLKN